MRALVLAAALLVAAALPAGAVRKCPPDSVPVGPICMDRYEASIWFVPDSTGGNRGVVKKILKGTITLGELQAAGARQIGEVDPPFSAETIGFHMGLAGNWLPLPGSRPPSPGVYAASVAGVLPSTSVSWHQVVQACALSGKRLPTNQEWQAAAAGTPDPGAADDGTTTCATMSTLSLTGARSACVSSWGTHDMVGNVAEMVADWVEIAGTCTEWSPAGTDSDLSCFGGPRVSFPGPIVSTEPARMLRGGTSFDGGVFSIEAINGLLGSGNFGGFRCAR